jgi:hypothetical protein
MRERTVTGLAVGIGRAARQTALAPARWKLFPIGALAFLPGSIPNGVGVPEPVSMAMLGPGLFGVAPVRRCRPAARGRKARRVLVPPLAELFVAVGVGDFGDGSVGRAELDGAGVAL